MAEKTGVQHDSYIVRIWQERTTSSGWRGAIIFTRTGQVRYFEELNALIAILQEITDQIPVANQSVHLR